MNRQAIALISGGLDSLLAARVIMDQGVEVLGVTFTMDAASRDVAAFGAEVRGNALSAGIPVRVVDISRDFLNILKYPPHGYGANANPCIDCRILMLQKARKIMEAEGAGFVVTGEVLGERPMSQKRVSLDIIMKYSTLEGLLVRPLSAKLLAETLPEKEGVIQREELLDISGRSRKRQYALAKKYGINRFFAPAGGCLLTDPMFARRVKDLMKNGAVTAEEIKLLKHGRHFRLTPDTKVVVGRNEEENGALMELKKEGDMMLMLTDLPGPSALLRGAIDGDNVKKTAAIVARYYTKGGDVELTVEGWTDDSDRISFNAVTMDEEELERLRV